MTSLKGYFLKGQRTISSLLFARVNTNFVKTIIVPNIVAYYIRPTLVWCLTLVACYNIYFTFAYNRKMFEMYLLSEGSGAKPGAECSVFS